MRFGWASRAHQPARGFAMLRRLVLSWRSSCVCAACPSGRFDATCDPGGRGLRACTNRTRRARGDRRRARHARAGINASNRQCTSRGCCGRHWKVEQSLACTNANLPLAALAAYTDRYLAERFSGSSGADEIGHLLAAAPRDPDPAAPGDVVTLVEVTKPVMYGDGRLGLTVVTANATDRYAPPADFCRRR